MNFINLNSCCSFNHQYLLKSSLNLRSNWCTFHMKKRTIDKKINVHKPILNILNMQKRLFKSMINLHQILIIETLRLMEPIPNILQSNTILCTI